MTGTIDILRGELERLFSLEEMTGMSRTLLGLDPEDVGGVSAKGSFARALTERCVDGDRIEALVDVILVSRSEVDPRVRDIAALLGTDDLPPGAKLGPYTIERKVASSDLGVQYLAKKDGRAFTVKTLRREAARDKRAVHRFLTANRLVATVDDEGLPKNLEAGEAGEGVYYVAYEYFDATPLSARLARTGPSHFNELKPLLRGILTPLAALHKAQLTHGDLKLDHVLLTRGAGAQALTGGASSQALLSGSLADVQVVLIDFGGDRLRPRLAHADKQNGGFGFLAVYGSPRTIAPEQVRGRPSDARTDVYAVGSMIYELLSGKPVFQADAPADAAFSHLAVKPEPPSSKAPRGWVTKEIDDWVLSMLDKNPASRPKDAGALLDQLDRLGRTAKTQPGATKIAPEKLESLLDMLQAAPDDSEAAIALEKAVDEGGDAKRIADAFAAAAAQVTGHDEDAKELEKALLYRAARIYDGAAGDKAQAEKIYQEIVQLDPSDEIAIIALEEVRRALGKYEEIVEDLLNRSESAEPGAARARLLSEIGRLYASELDDAEQALVAYAQAICELPTDEEYASEVERLAAGKVERWNEVLGTMTEAVKGDTLSPSDRIALLDRIARWYETKVGRADLALMAYQQILSGDPASELALEGLTTIYRRAQQWPELAGVLLKRADAAGSTPRSRDLRTEAAELFENRLNDNGRAQKLYEAVLAEDPGHVKAGDALARIAEKNGDFAKLASLYEERMHARRGEERTDALVKLAEVYEDNLDDLAKATQKYEELLATDPTNLNGLKGLDRIYNRTGRYRELLDVLARQVSAAATPRQKINLYERIASLHDEEFLDHAKAAEAREAILELDPANDASLTALARHYRHLAKWEDLVKLYEKHADTTGDEARRVELLVQRARVLAEQIGSPERATKAYDQILELAPGHAGALEALARLRELSGDAHAALSAIEALAAKATTGEAKAEQWVRAAKLLEARGDRDGAIERYKLALEANRKDAAASVALRDAFLQRGDHASVIALIEKELEVADGALAKGRLLAEQARIFKGPMADTSKAETFAKRALELDASNLEAQLVLADLAYEASRFIEASKAYEALVGRVGALAKEEATRTLVRFVEAAGKAASLAAPPSSAAAISQAALSQTSLDGPASGTFAGPASGGRISAIPGSVYPPGNPKIAAAVEALERVAPDDVHALVRVAKVVLEQGDPQTAKKTYDELVSKHAVHLTASEKGEVFYGLGESLRRLGDLDGAIEPLQQAANFDSASPAPLRALARVYEEKGSWSDVIRVKKRRLDLAVGQERFDLLIEIGDVYLQKLSDRTLASKTYVAALEEKPDDRKLLTRLMQLYSEEKDWAKLLEVVLRLADFVEDKKQRAKYMHTAAAVAARQLGERNKAIEYYDRALELDPTLSKALEEAIELRRNKHDHDGVERLLKMQLDQAKDAQDREKLREILDQLGELYQKFLNEPEMAIDAYEAATAFDPENKQRAETLAELYASDVGQYLEKAVKSQAQILKRNPYRVESYKLLRRLYTEAKRADSAWCLCQALSVLNLAEPDEERFYKRHRTDSAAPAQSVLSDEDWTKLAHADQDALLTRIFATIQPTIIRARTQPLEQTGYDMRYAIDLSMHPYPISQTLYYAAGVLGMPAPLVFQNPNDPGGLGFLHAHQPAIVLGRAAFETQVSPQALSFIGGRHLAYFRPGYYVRHLVPTGTGLKAWLFAAIKLSVPQFPVAPDLQGQVNEAMASMNQDLDAMARERLASLVSKLLQAGGALDLKKWVTSVDLTVDRAGLLLAHDLMTTTEGIRATDDTSSVAVKERMKEAVLFSISEEYFSIRSKLLIAIDS